MSETQAAGAASAPEATPESVGARGPYHPLRVSRVIEETPEARSFVLEVPPDLADRFAYRAGQFLTFRLEVSGERLVRCYSLASSPDVDSEPKVTVKRIEDGRVSNAMNDQISAGSVLEVMRPAGVFCLRESAAPIVLFSGGSGITPVVSLVKSALSKTRRSLRLVYANRDRDSIIFREELDELAAKHPGRLELVHRLDDEEGFIDEAAVRGYVGTELAADFYICGPGAFMDTVESTLQALGVSSDQLFIERFLSLSEGASGEAAPAAPVEGDAAPERLRISLDGQTKDVAYQPGETVLEAARRGDLEPPFACEEGYCSCCMAKLVKGRVRMKANDALDDDQVADGWILTCQSVPLSDEIEVEYPD